MENRNESQLSYGREDSARRLGIPVRSLDRLLATKQLRSFKIGKRRVVSAHELEKFVKKLESAAR